MFDRSDFATADLADDPSSISAADGAVSAVGTDPDVPLSLDVTRLHCRIPGYEDVIHRENSTSCRHAIVDCT